MMPGGVWMSGCSEPRDSMSNLLAILANVSLRPNSHPIHNPLTMVSSVALALSSTEDTQRCIQGSSIPVPS